MKVAILSMNFPPEVNALAARTHGHARVWSDLGEVEVITDVPHFPEGEIYHGYRNSHLVEYLDGIAVRRVPMFVTPNRGVLRRSLSFFSYMASSLWYGGLRLKAPDVVVASSPQLLTAVSGYLISKLKSVPFVLEVRDLWPDSLVAGGAMERNWMIRSLEVLERFLYRSADHIVVVTESFRDHVTEQGASPSDVSVIMNAVDREFLTGPSPEEVHSVRRRYGLDGRFVVSYIGTVGTSHRADVLLEAAQQCSDDEILFMVVGGGAAWKRLGERARAADADNFRLVEKQPRSRMPAFLAATDVSLVHLRDHPLFETVIPSKLFEAMAVGNPVIHGVRGESKEIVERSGAGIPVTPESPDEIVRAARRLKEDPELYRRMSERAVAYVAEHHDRRELGRRYWRLLRDVAQS